MDDDRRAIEADCTRLIHDYANRNDAGDWPAVASFYTDDGRMIRPTIPDAPVIGRDAILAAFTARPARVTRHVCANIVVSVVNADHATAFSVILLFTGDPGFDGAMPVRDDRPPLVGTYHDRLVRTDNGWRFAERVGALSFAA